MDNAIHVALCVIPVAVVFTDQITAGADHACAREAATQEVVCWGNAAAGRIEVP